MSWKERLRKRASTAPDRLTALPPELLQIIVNSLTEQDTDHYIRNATLRKLAATSHHYYHFLLPLVYETATLAFTAEYHVPTAASLLRWQKPKLQNLLDERPEICPLIKSIHIRIEPFPVRRWTVRDCHQLMMHVHYLTPISGGPCAGMRRRKPSLSLPLKPSDQQDLVIGIYAEIFEHAYKDEWHSPFAQDVTDTARQVLASLPSLRHAEVVGWRQDIVRRRCPLSSQLERLSFAYAHRLMLTCIPLHVRSAKFTCMAAQKERSLWGDYNPFGVSRELLSAGRILSGSINRLDNEYPALKQLTKLRIDISGLRSWMATSGPATEPAFRYWQNFLNRMSGVSELGLGYTEGGERVQKERYLEELFRGVTMPAVERLELRDWIVTVPLLTEQIQRSFPSVQHLRIVGCVMES